MQTNISKVICAFFVYAIQFLDGGNCDFDVTGARKKNRLSVNILSNI